VQSRNLILASSSSSRREQLQRLGLRFKCHSPDIDESPLESESPAELIRRLSIAKARAVAPHHPDSLIISGDQTAMVDGDFINKPGNRDLAVAQLYALQGRETEFLSGLCVQNSSSGDIAYQSVECHVRFRRLSLLQVENYVDTDKPFHCAGSFKCEAAGIGLFEYIRSDDPSAITGMPLIAAVSLLAEHGFELFT